MNSFKTFFVFTVLAASVLTATAGELPGTLIDFTSKDPIAGADIRGTAPGLELSTTTGTNGSFVLVLPDPPPPSLRLTVQAAGYQTLDLNLTDLVHTIQLSLQAHPIFASEIEVTGLRADVGETPVTVTEVDREEIERFYWAQDVPIFLSPTPGFYAYNDSGNGIGYSYFFLRSFDMRRTAVSLNGVPLNDAHSHGLFFDHRRRPGATGRRYHPLRRQRHRRFDRHPHPPARIREASAGRSPRGSVRHFTLHPRVRQRPHRRTLGRNFPLLAGAERRLP
jgi:iron complex outermembrane receptor protein